jgi:hypothetical protein
MNHRPPGGGGGPLEVAVLWVCLAVGVGFGLLWGSGVVVGSLFGSSLPAGRDGILAILRSFPDVGRAWSPPILTWLVWSVAVTFAGLFGPLAWRAVRLLRGRTRGARWADTADLRRYRLLVRDVPLPHSRLEDGTADETP